LICSGSAFILVSPRINKYRYWITEKNR
jgi:hypothetical protein